MHTGSPIVDQGTNTSRRHSWINMLKNVANNSSVLVGRAAETAIYVCKTACLWKLGRNSLFESALMNHGQLSAVLRKIALQRFQGVRCAPGHLESVVNVKRLATPFA